MRGGQRRWRVEGEARSETRGIEDGDGAAECSNSQASALTDQSAIGLQFGKETGECRRIGRDHDDLVDGEGAVAMPLIVRLPEILRRVLLTDEESSLRHARLGDEGKREADGHLAAVGQLGEAREIERRVCLEAARGKFAVIAPRVVARKDKHRHTLAGGQEPLVEGGKGKPAGFDRRDQAAIHDGEQFEEIAVKLHEAVAGAERMRGLRRQGEAKTLIPCSRRVEIAHAENKVVKRTFYRHGGTLAEMTGGGNLGYRGVHGMWKTGMAKSNTDTSIELYRLVDDGEIPNNETLPLIVYRDALPPDADPADAFEALFARNGWSGGWRNGIYPYHHYHSTAHEVLGIPKGAARVRFGGDKGETVAVRAGDVVVVPPGSATRRKARAPISSSSAPIPTDAVRISAPARATSGHARLPTSPRSRCLTPTPCSGKPGR